MCSLYSQYVNGKAIHLPDVKSAEVKSRRKALSIVDSMCNAMVTSSRKVQLLKRLAVDMIKIILNQRNGETVIDLSHVISSDSVTVYGYHVVDARVTYIHVIKLPRNCIELPVSKPWIVTHQLKGVVNCQNSQDNSARG